MLDELKAVWSTSYMNNLPDSSFLYVEDGGKKDSEGKTTPRSLRHFPYKDANGKVDLPHLRNALARIPQSSLSADVKARAIAKAQSIAKANGVDTGKSESLASESMVYYGGEVKALPDGKVGGYLVLFTGPDNPDLAGDYFTKSTEFYVE